MSGQVPTAAADGAEPLGGVARPGIHLRSLSHLYAIPMLLMVACLAALVYAFIPAPGARSGSEVTATVFADARELRLEELPRSLSAVFQQTTVLERANRLLEREGFQPISSFELDDVEFDPIEGTPFARVVVIDDDPDDAEARALAVAQALVVESNEIGPTFGEFTVLSDLQVEEFEGAGLAPRPRLLVAVLAASLVTAASFLAFLSLRLPVVEGIRASFPVVTVTNNAPWLDEPKLTDFFGSGRVAEFVLMSNGPTYFASRPRSRRFTGPLVAGLAEHLRIPRIEDPADAAPGQRALGELTVGTDRDVAHVIAGQDPRIILVAREGSPLRPLADAAAQFPPESILALVVERRRYHLFSAPWSDSSIGGSRSKKSVDHGVAATPQTQRAAVDTTVGATKHGRGAGRTAAPSARTRRKEPATEGDANRERT